MDLQRRTLLIKVCKPHYFHNTHSRLILRFLAWKLSWISQMSYSYCVCVCVCVCVSASEGKFFLETRYQWYPHRLPCYMGWLIRSLSLSLSLSLCLSLSIFLLPLKTEMMERQTMNKAVIPQANAEAEYYLSGLQRSLQMILIALIRARLLFCYKFKE
jgi:hypothetical protein